ncbi:hypothetical protein ACJIZ3_003038 [Penstemon smallii]|uniref:non-specific serine/threonine protein kinase n=1 Tax=Penstemon smallii TaxID=265156 RepID=A0ABD3UB52_9LAMI
MAKLSYKNPFIIIIIFCCLYFYLITTPINCTNNQTDLQSLLYFKNSISNDPNRALISWNETTHFCNWRGISCTQNRVVSINLTSQSLFGSLSPHLGTIPHFIGNFTSLERLSLANCGLEGEIPESLSQLHVLWLLTLYENRLSGRIPSGLYNISTMSVFSMRDNRLRGTIPSDIGFTFPRLRVLDLGENHFHGSFPFSLSNSSVVERINLSSNNLTGELVIDFTRLSVLESFIVSSNYLEGDVSFISSMSNCTRLVVLSLFDNLLSGSLPDSIGNLSINLSLLSIGGNRLHGTIPSSIGNLFGLTLLNFANNVLEGSVPFSIGNLNRLQEIYLGVNRFTNEIPFSFGNMTLLNHLFLGENNFHGSIPQSLSNCRNLLTLYVARNNLSGSIPREIMSLSSISISFDLSHNDFSGSIPSEVGSLRNLENLDLSHNRLSGRIPNSLSGCISLVLLHLEGNFLDGEIPERLSVLTGMQDLDLSQNNLSGPIPRFLGEMDLVSLNLSFNRLLGEVPTLGRIVWRNFVLKPPSLLVRYQRKLSKTMENLDPTKRKMQQNQSPMPSFEAEFLRLSYADLLKATSGFSEANLLGAGRFGSVYKGILDNGKKSVAVKVLNLTTKGASKSFISECNALRVIRHRNLVKIVSTCQSTDFRGNDFKALVYEYMENGSLDEWLHKKLDKENKKYGMGGMVSTEGDVYSYGILLLEMFTGKRPTDDAFEGHSTLHDIVESALTNEVIMEIVDPIILQEHKDNNNNNNNNNNSIKINNCIVHILKIGVACSEELPRNRMLMTDVVNELYKIACMAE